MFSTWRCHPQVRHRPLREIRPTSLAQPPHTAQTVFRCRIGREHSESLLGEGLPGGGLRTTPGLATFPAEVAVPDTATVLNKWKTRTSGAAADYAEGARRTEKDPTQLAIAAGPRYIQEVQAAFQSGRWANGLRKSGKAGWLAGVEGKGQQNFANGVNNADDKFTAAFSKLLPYVQNVQNQVNAMPNITAADRKNRMNRAFDLMSQYKGS